VNGALALIKQRGEPAPAGAFEAPAWLPATGAATCIAMLLAALAR
jgi:hypothetical protein